MSNNSLDRQIRIRDKDINPLFEDESGNYFKDKVMKYLEGRDIDYTALDEFSKIKVIQKMIKACKRCELRKGCKNPLEPWIPSRDIKAVFITRSPSDSENKIGIPLHSEAPGGNFFSKYLDILGLSRGEIMISNLIHCKSDDSKNIKFDFVSTCSLWKLLEFNVVNLPKFIFTLGSYPLKMFMGYKHPNILRIFGDIYKVDLMGELRYIVPLLHPGYLLRTSEFRQDVNKILVYVRDNIIKEEGW